MFALIKPEGWNNLSAEQQQYLRKLSAKDVGEALRHTAQSDNNVLFSFLLKNTRKHAKPIELDRVLEYVAREEKKSALLQEMLSIVPPEELRENKFFSTRSLMVGAATEQNLAGWRLLTKWMDASIRSFHNNFLSEEDRADIAARYGFEAGLKSVFEKTQSINVINAALAGAMCPHCPDTFLEKLLSEPPFITLNSDDKNALLTSVIEDTCDTASIKKIGLLLQAGGKVTEDALKCSTHISDIKNFDFLLKNWEYDDAVRSSLIHCVHDDVLEIVADKLNRKRDGETTKTPDRYTATLPDTLIETLRLPDGGTLTNVFNFSDRRHFVLSTSPTGSSSTPHVIEFDDITNDKILERAGDELIRQGADAEFIKQSIDPRRALRFKKG